MKILTYKHGGETAVGVLKNDGSEVVPVNYLGCSAIDMNTFLDVQNEKKLEKLDRNKVCEYSEAYHTTNVKKLCSLLRRL